MVRSKMAKAGLRGHKKSTSLNLKKKSKMKEPKKVKTPNKSCKLERNKR